MEVDPHTIVEKGADSFAILNVGQRLAVEASDGHLVDITTYDDCALVRHDDGDSLLVGEEGCRIGDLEITFEGGS